MFDSGITASGLITDLKSEVDVALPVPDEKYLEWLSALEQLLYGMFIQEQKKLILPGPVQNPVNLKTLSVGDDEANIRYEDIYTIFADGLQLIESTVTSGEIFTNTWYKTDGQLGYNTIEPPQCMEIVYFVRPKIKQLSNNVLPETSVFVPFEFLDMVRAKLRGEAYKMANEDSLAAKWLNDYNVLLQNFKTWILRKKAQFGM